MNKQNNVFGKKVIAFITSFGFIAGTLGVSVALAAITFSGSSITGDSLFNSITGASSTTFDVGSGNTLSLQTTNNGPITIGSGLLTTGGFVSASNNVLFASGKGIDSSAAGTLLIGNSTSTGITIGRSGQVVSFPGSVSSTAIDWTGAMTIGNTAATGITIGRSGQVVSFPGNVSTTGTLTSGSSTVNGSFTVTGAFSPATLSLTATTNQLVLGTTTTTTITAPTPAASRTYTIPDNSGTSVNFVLAPNSATTTFALFATATGGSPAYRAIALGDLPTQTGSGNIVLSTGAALTSPTITTNALFAAGAAIDSSAAGTLLIGNSTSTGITIGRSGQTVSFPGSVSSTAVLVTGNATTTNLSVTAFSSGCLSVGAGGVVATSTCSGGGTVTTSTALTANNFPFWGTAGGALSGTSTLSVSGTTLTQANNFLLGGTLNVTSTSVFAGLATFNAGITETGATNSLASTTVAGILSANTFNSTSTATFGAALTQSGGTASLASTTVLGSLTINSGAPILKHLSATSSLTFGVIASSSCATLTMTVTGANAGDNVYAAPTPVASGLETVSASWNAYASSTNTIAIKACNPTVANTASVAAEVWRADVWQH